ncbi:histone-lysine N-methyltransferase 2C-like isoform X4 [Lineus longissimus]|uniref:histone-lysine N-methyltransferase 2C-like isoform X4 n=1 Tax=Lineus longissimus TaxID=88925 RepID=UPI00315C9AB7
MAATRTRIKIKKPEGDEGGLVVTTITEPIDPPPDGSGTEISSTEIRTRGPGRSRKEGDSPVPTKEKKKHKHKKHKRHKHEKHHHRHHQDLDALPSTSTDTSIAAEPSSAETTNQGIEEEKMEEDGAEAEPAGETATATTSTAGAADDDFDATFDDFLKSLSAPSQISETQAAAEKMLAEADEEALGILCSLCNCGERSLLGQGDMTQYEPTPNFNHVQAFKKLVAAKGTRRSSSETDKDIKEKEGDISPPSQPKKPKIRSQRERSKSPRRQAGALSGRAGQDDRNKYIPDELAMVGYLEDTDVLKVFDGSFVASAHHCCAAWSEGVIQAEDYTLQYVDKAVIAGLTQKCHYCQRYGATIFCRHPKCNRKYHYPCAPASGCFQDIKTMSLLCPDHTDLAEDIAGMESFCVVCDTPGDILEQLFCTSCGQHYHGNCLDPSVEMNPVVRAGWQCPECKICQTCRQPGDDNKMLVCDTCDKGYHTFCLRPAMTTIPKNGWKCKNCRVCGDCSSKTAGIKHTARWHLNYTVCESCYQHRNKGQSCPVCQKAYSAKNITHLSMVNCQLCKRYVHLECDESAEFSGSEAMAARACYVCPMCHDNESNNDAVEDANLTDSLTAMIDQTDLKDFDALDLFKDTQPYHGAMNNSQDSLLLSEDSLPMDVDGEKSRYAGSGQSVSGGKPLRSHGPGKGKPSIGKKKFLFGNIKGRNPYTGKKRRAHIGDKKRSRAPKYKSSASSSKGGDDDDHHSTVVLCSSKDELVLQQDMCLACGSFGVGEEGKLISCTQCGQCYHPYCVSIKVTKIVLQKGWRCLDCTVCEGCGKPHDEGRLILCDECDISYHIYCLDPPLDHVPKGTWKCKWCAVCVTCGTTQPGFSCTWQNQYSQCGPCASYSSCPSCQRKYSEDELIIQCTQCDRWLHAMCDGLKSEDDAERASDFGYQCMFCRVHTGVPGPLPPPPTPSPEPEPEPMPSPQTVWHQEYPTKQPRYFTVDGIQLSENGFAHLKSITVESPAKKRTLRLRHHDPSMSKHPNISRLLSMSERSDISEEFDEGFLKDRGITQQDPDHISGDPHDDDDHEHDHEIDESYEKKDGDVEKKKRQRHRKPGIGGFIPRPKGGRSIFKKGTLITKLPLELLPPADREREEKLLMLECRKKKKLGRRKGPLEDNYPSYLQEAFFGKLLEKPTAGDMDLDDLSEEEKKDEFSPRVKETFPFCLSPRKEDDDHLVGEDLKDMIDLLPSDLAHDEEILGMIGDDFKEPGDDSQDELEMPSEGHGKDNLTERFDQMLGNVGKSLDVDKMLSEGLAQIDSKMVEDIFKGVLSPHPSSTSPAADQAGTFTLPPIPATMPSGPRPQPPTTLAPFSIPPAQQGFHGGDFSPQFSPSFSDAPGAPMWPGQDDNEEQLSYNKRNIMKWEKDEPLGDMSSISPVLYANMNHPELKAQYPDWNERAKQIAKIWRRVPPDAKTPYLAKARENRASSRLQRTAKMVIPEQPKPVPMPPMMAPTRGPAGQMLPPPPPRQKQMSVEEKFMKEQRAIREQEQERQWKHLQQMRHQQAQERKIDAVISKVIADGEEMSSPQGVMGGMEGEAGSQGQVSREGSLPSTPDSIGPQFVPPTSKPGPPWDRDPYALPPGTPRPVPSVEQFPGPRPPMDPYAHQPGTPRPEPQPRPPMDHIRPMGPHDGFQGMPRPIDPYALPPGTPRSSSSFTRPSGPRMENVSQPQLMPRIPDEIMRARMAQAAAENFGHQSPRSGAPPFPLPGPRTGDPFAQGQRKPGPQSAMIGQLRMQRPPRLQMPDSFGPRGPGVGNIRPPESFQIQNHPSGPGPQDAYTQQPGTPGSLPKDPFGQQPSTPRPVSTESFSMGQRPPDQFIPSLSRSSSQESFTHQQTSQASPVGSFPPGVEGQDVDPNLQQILSGERSHFMEDKPGQLAADQEAQKQDIQRHQLRELLAKQTKERQKQKEQDRLMQERSQMPLRHWPSQEDVPGQGSSSQPQTPMSQSFPSPGVDTRPQGPGFPGQFGPRMMERWADQPQMIRPPHPNQIRPDGGQFSPHDVGPRGPFSGEWRGPRPGQPGHPMGPRMSPGQMPQRGPGFIELRHPHEPGDHPRPPFMQMVPERMRGPAPGLPSPRTSMPPGTPNPLDPFDSMVVRQQQQQRMPGMEQTVRLSHMPDKQTMGMPPGSSATTVSQTMSSPVRMHSQQLPVTMTDTTVGQQMASEGTQQQPGPARTQTDKPKSDVLDEPNDGEIDDLLGADGSFNLLEYADPDLDSALHEATQDKSIFDEHLGLKKPDKTGKEEEKKSEEGVAADAVKTEIKSEDGKDDKSDDGSKDSADRAKQVGDFQAQFLAFSRRMSEKDTDKEGGENTEGIKKEEMVMVKQERPGSAVQSPQMAAIKQAASAQMSPTSPMVSTPSQVASQSPMHSPQINALMQMSPRPGSHTPSSIPSPYAQPPAQMSPRIGVPSPFSQKPMSHSSSMPPTPSFSPSQTGSPNMTDRNTPNQTAMLPSPQQQMPPVRPPVPSSAPNAATTHSALSQALASPSKASQGLLPQEQQMLAMVQQRLQGPRGFRPPFPMQNKPYPPGSKPMQRPMGQQPMQSGPGGRMPGPGGQMGPRGYMPASQGMMQRMPGFHPRMMDPRMMDPRMMEQRMMEPRMMEPRMMEPRMMEPRMMEPRMMDPRMMAGGSGMQGGPGMPPRGPPGMTPGHATPPGMSPGGSQVTPPGTPGAGPRQPMMMPGAGQGMPQRMQMPRNPSPMMSPTQQQTREQKERALLLEEQPLLLEDLLEQEKIEQRHQQEQQAIMQKQDTGLLSDADFEKLRADVMGDVPRKPSPFPMGQPQGPPRMMSPQLEAARMQHMGPQGARDSAQTFPRGPPPAYPGPQMSSRTPSPFAGPSGMYPPAHSPSMPHGPPGGPPGPPGPPGDHMGDPDRKQQAQYEEWLMHQMNVHSMQIKYLEQQVAKQRKAKKALNARQRQARKVGSELSEADAMDLDRIGQEQANMQKELDQVRKQQRQHQMVMQDYRTKQQERVPGWPGPGPPQQGQVLPPSSMPAGPPGQQMMGPRSASGQGNTARLPASVRLEYEAYMQQRLRMMNQGMRQPMVTSGVSGTSMAPFTPASATTVPLTLPTSLVGPTHSPITVTSPQLGPSGVGSPKGNPRASTPTGHPSPAGTPTGGPPLQQVQMIVQQLHPGQPRLNAPGGQAGTPIRVSIPNQYMQQSQLQPGQRMEHPYPGHMMRHPGQQVQHVVQAQGSGLLSTANKPGDAQKDNNPFSESYHDMERMRIQRQMQQQFEHHRQLHDEGKDEKEMMEERLKMPMQMAFFREQAMPMGLDPRGFHPAGMRMDGPRPRMPLRYPEPGLRFPDPGARFSEPGPPPPSMPNVPSGFKLPPGEAPSPGQMPPGFSMLPHFPSLEGAGFPGEPSKLDKPKKKRKKRTKKGDQLAEGAPAAAALPSLLGVLGSSPTMSNTPMSTSGSTVGTPTTSQPSTPLSAPPNPMQSAVEPMDTNSPHSQQSVPKLESEMKSSPGTAVGPEGEVSKVSPPVEDKDACSDTKSSGESKSQECTDGKHCGDNEGCTDGQHCGDNEGCTDGQHCGENENQECTDGKHCGENDKQENERQECTDGKNCGENDKQECTDGQHCGESEGCTDGQHCGENENNECTDGQHCGESESCTDGLHCGENENLECADGQHCGESEGCTDGQHCGENEGCTDGLHCGENENQECTDGQHCGENEGCTDRQHRGENEGCTDGLHCGENEKQECTDGQHCGENEGCTDGQHRGENEGCTDGLHCGENENQECTDGQHCGENEGCTDGLHCGENENQECTDGQHCGENEGCTDGLHCGENEGCTDGKHCGENEGCTDGLHCGENENQNCTDGQHCGESEGCTDGQHCGENEGWPDGKHCGEKGSLECTDGKHCGENEGQECTDGKHCGENENPQDCTDGKHCGENEGQECTDGKHCGENESQECTDGKHCGENENPQDCTDGKHCGENESQECTDGKHCGENEGQGCTDGKHCGENENPQDCTDGKHCGENESQECTDGKHCGENEGQECTDGKHCGENESLECTDGKHCGENEGQECTDGKHCGENENPQDCTDGKHCGENESQECTDGKHCGENENKECTDGKHCGENDSCTDGKHCGENDKEGCTDGKHCGENDQNDSGNQGASTSQCSDGLHCGENEGENNQNPQNSGNTGSSEETNPQPSEVEMQEMASEGANSSEMDNISSGCLEVSEGVCSDGRNCPGNDEEKQQQEGSSDVEQTSSVVNIPVEADDTPMEVVEEQIIEEVPVDVPVSVEEPPEAIGMDLSMPHQEKGEDLSIPEQAQESRAKSASIDVTPVAADVALEASAVVSPPPPPPPPPAKEEPQADSSIDLPIHLCESPKTLPADSMQIAQDLSAIPLPPSPEGLGTDMPSIEPSSPAPAPFEQEQQLPIPSASESTPSSPPAESAVLPPILPEPSPEQMPEVSPDSTPMDLSVHREQPEPAHQPHQAETAFEVEHVAGESPEAVPEDLSMHAPIKSELPARITEDPKQIVPLEPKREIGEREMPLRSPLIPSPAHAPEMMKSPKHPLPSPTEHRPLFTPPAAEGSKSPKAGSSPRRSPGAVTSPRRSPAAHLYPAASCPLTGQVMADVKPTAKELERARPASLPIPEPVHVREDIRIKTEPSEPSICSSQRSTPSSYLPMPAVATSHPPTSQLQRPLSHPGHAIGPAMEGIPIEMQIPRSLQRAVSPRMSIPSSLPMSASHAMGTHHHPGVPPGHPMFGQARMPGQPHLVHSGQGQGQGGHPHFHGQRMPMRPFGLHPHVRTSVPHQFSGGQNMQTFQQRPSMSQMQQTIMSRMSGPPPRPSPMIQHSQHPNRPSMPGQMPPHGLERMPADIRDIRMQGEHLRMPGERMRMPGEHLRMQGDPRMQGDLRMPMPGSIRLAGDIRMPGDHPRMPGDIRMQMPPSSMGMHVTTSGMPGPRPAQQGGLFMPPVPMSSPNRMQLSPGAQMLTSQPSSRGSPVSGIPTHGQQHSPGQAMPPSHSPGMGMHPPHSPIHGMPPSRSPSHPMPPHSHGQMMQQMHPHPHQMPRAPSPGQAMTPTSIPMALSPAHHQGHPPRASPAKTPPETSKTPPNSDATKKISDALLDATIESVVAAAAGGELLSPVDEEEYSESEAAREEFRHNQNMLLKQLLASPNQEGKIAMLQGSDDEDPNVHLTPEQQRQLAAIDSMPLTMEMELSPEEWASKTQEEKDHIIEFLTHSEMGKKQDYAKKRKQFEDQQKKKKKRERKQRRKLEKEGDGPPKKRKKQKHAAQDYTTRMEAILNRLRKMPLLQLQEPPVGANIPQCSVFGGGNSQNKLFGNFGNSLLDGVTDCYSQPPFVPPAPPQPKLPPGLPQIQAFERNVHGERVPRVLPDGPSMMGKCPISMLMQKDKEQEQMKREQERAQLAQKGILGAQRPRTPSLPPPPLIEARLPSRASSTPDSMVSCSSPECFTGEKVEKFPLLKVIKEEPMEADEATRVSPVVPVIAPVPIRPSPMKIKQEKEAKRDKFLDDPELGEFIMKEKENLATIDTPFEREAYAKKIAGLSAFTRPLKDSQFLENQVSVTLTLSAPAADDINHVIFAIAELLKIAVPPSYEIGRTTSPDHFKVGKKFGYERQHKEEAVNIHSLIKSKVKFCRHCDVAIQDSGIRKRMRDIPHLVKEEQAKDNDDEEVTFCSMNCYMQFAITHRSIASTTPKKDGHNVVDHKTDVDRPPLGYVHTGKSAIPYPQLPKVGDVAKAVKLRRRSNSMDNKPLPKKWKGVRYRRVDASFGFTGKKYVPTSDAELEELRRLLDMMVVPDPVPEDQRKCVLCFQFGDLDSCAEGRILNMDIDKWIHLNCALWSSEVYETLNGALMNVDTAVKRGLTTECMLCSQGGATLTCFKQRCSSVYHLGCALEAKCMFFQDKTIFCPIHAPKGHPENELLSLEVYRKVYLNREENRQLAKMIQEEDRSHTTRIGALTFHNIGQLLPHQLQTGKFHTKLYIYPVGFKTSRFYWSMRYVNKRARYDCSIVEAEGRPEFIVKVEEKGHDVMTLKEPSPKAVWLKILEKVEKLRRDAQYVKVFPSFLSGEDMFGLGEPAIIRIIESLPGVELLKDYGFRYGRSPLIELPLAINPTGCARSEPKFRTHFRKPHALQSSSSSRSLPSTVTGFSGDLNSPYMKQFVHSKSQQYRRLKTEWQNNVYLGRSRIQGLGLFAARDLEKHTMVIEYIGELIRNEVAEKREKEYEAQNRGTYMFRLETDFVVDATLTGGHARYVNHCCQPNCVAEVVPFEKESKIIIIANRRVARGEELTYDYKFDFEDDHKIPCLCGAVNCRKWMN